ncbi:MAG TPA: hypothetical protein VNL71_08330 [Chloroflexota bacterium]|nr:hypothetical protein [Chloroflexota bacterium]
MRRVIFLACIVIIPLCRIGAAYAAPSALPTVKTIAQAFGQAIQRDDGGAAVNLLAPDLRTRLGPRQLPALLGVARPPLGTQVIRWAFAREQGDATLVLRYPDGPVTEQLSLRLYHEGWRITSILHEDAAALERAAESVVVAFCDAALNDQPALMRAQLTGPLLGRLAIVAPAMLLGLHAPVQSYLVQGYWGGASGAEVWVTVRSSTQSARDLFEVINDREGWRVAGISTLIG